jgi:TrmH family RNA methyltransferase
VLLALPIFTAPDVTGLIQQGCQVFAAEATGDGAVPIDTIEHVPRKLVLAVGNESRGLSAQLRSQAATRFTIPLSRDVESLNVAATAAIALFHFTRLPKGK